MLPSKSLNFLLIKGFALLFLVIGCKNQTIKNINYDNSANILHQLNKSLSEAVILDGFSPPVASRIYAYSNIAAYETIRWGDTSLRTLEEQIPSLKDLPRPNHPELCDFRVSMVSAFCDVAVSMVYRDYIIEAVKKTLLDSLQVQNKSTVFIQSIEYGKNISAVINRWAGQDYYSETRNAPKFQPSEKPGTWIPTPPVYGDGLEPHWMKIRPLILDSSRIDVKTIPPVFDTNKKSTFYQMALEVYEKVNNITEDQKRIADYWDDNPQVAVNQGHLMGLRRQLTPPGHWIGIAQSLCEKENKSVFESAEIYTLLSISFFDVIISVWESKYRNNLVRPESYINQYIDPNWRPYLESPLFPEYPSGHSGISRSSATILIHFFGDNYSFTDSVNIPFGKSAESFHSLIEASDQAAMSRVFGGIHYDPGRLAGFEYGDTVAKLVLKKIRTRK